MVFPLLFFLLLVTGSKDDPIDFLYSHFSLFLRSDLAAEVEELLSKKEHIAAASLSRQVYKRTFSLLGYGNIKSFVVLFPAVHHPVVFSRFVGSVRVCGVCPGLGHQPTDPGRHQGAAGLARGPRPGEFDAFFHFPSKK